MKGTVRKSEAVATLEQAERILHVPKEEAENLMIVDLVRHDLHAICGPGKVSVPRLLVVEEYQSVFQMVTVVEGELPLSLPALSSVDQIGGKDGQTDGVLGDAQDGNGNGNDATTTKNSSKTKPQPRYTGLDVLAASLPPGSMTGAPKKRSCELLQQIEQHRERSLYSGVVGYMCATGRGDWSVTIRCLFRWDDEQQQQQQQSANGAGAGAVNRVEGDSEVWHIGAGGAVTILSTPQGEREEMFTKLAGPLRVFAEV
jgi:para-aminobenzoate synthetase